MTTENATESEIERIREQKRQQLLDGEMESNADSTQAAPADPVYADGRDHVERFVDEQQVVLVDFYADWCGPCQMLDPIVTAVARKTPAAVLKVDLDQHIALAREQGVQSVPTIVLYVDGQPVKRMLGVQDEGTLSDLVEQYAN